MPFEDSDVDKWTKLLMILGAERLGKQDCSAPLQALRASGSVARPDGLYHIYCCDEFTYRWHLNTMIPTTFQADYFRIGFDQEPPAGKYTIFVKAPPACLSEKIVFLGIKGSSLFPSMRLLGSERFVPFEFP